jgi:hypothetical protein
MSVGNHWLSRLHVSSASPQRVQDAEGPGPPKHAVQPVPAKHNRQAENPSHDITSRPPGSRPTRKSTLQHRFTRDIEQFTNDNGVISSFYYKKSVKKIHTNAVASALKKREPDCVLGIPAPEVYLSEGTLPRAERTTLRQLR